MNLEYITQRMKENIANNEKIWQTNPSFHGLIQLLKSLLPADYNNDRIFHQATDLIKTFYECGYRDAMFDFCKDSKEFLKVPPIIIVKTE